MSAPARARFFRRVVVGLVALVAMAGLGGRTGVGLAALAILAGTFVLAAVVVTVRGGAGPLRAVMDAADRVADGDYAVRVREAGPPPADRRSRPPA